MKMRKTLLMTVLIIAVAGVTHAVEPEDRGVDTGTFSEHNTAPATVIANMESGDNLSTAPDNNVSEALLTVRQNYAFRLDALIGQLKLVTDQSEELTIENRISELKLEAQRAELTVLLEEARSNGDTNYAMKLEQALATGVDANPSNLPSLQRDPVTNRPVDSQNAEGGAK